MQGGNIIYELTRTRPKSFHISYPAKISVSKINDTQICLIDSGNDKDAGQKVRQILEREGQQLRAIIDTHPDADHIGGNRYLRQQTGRKVYAEGVGTAFTAYPKLEPAFLYGGYPFADLRYKFSMALSNQVSNTDSLYEDETLKGLEIILLPGHFFQMVGMRIPNGTLFLVDCLSSRATPNKYKVSLIYDVASYLETPDKVMIAEVILFIPAHVKATDSIHSLVEYNKQYIHGITTKLLELCTTPQTFESVLKTVFGYRGLTISFQQHVLVDSIIRSYLAWLKDTGLLQAYVRDNRII